MNTHQKRFSRSLVVHHRKVTRREPNLRSYLRLVRHGLACLSDREKPTFREAATAILGNARMDQIRKGRYVPMRSARKGNEPAECLRKVSEWLGSGGNLHGLMYAQFRWSDGGLFGRMNTLAILLREIAGAGSPALSNWKRAFGYE